MGRRVTVAVLALLASVVLTNSAQAQNIYLVQGTADSGLASCTPISTVPNGLHCDTLRAAVTAANANVGQSDAIYLQAAGNYVVNSSLDLTDSVTILGRGPRTTTVRGSGLSRVFTVAAGAEAILTRLTVADGQAGSGEGGNILNNGTLGLSSTRVTGGNATGGGGIASAGAASLTILNSLIDHNDAHSGIGGGVLNRSADGSMDVINSTIGSNSAFNGGGIGINTSANTTTLFFVTIARNAITNTGAGGAGIHFANGDADADASLLASNTVPGGTTRNCGGAGQLFEGTSGTNREDGSTCPFDSPNSGVSVSAGLENQGGDTDVFTIPPTGGAKDALSPCDVGVGVTTDQRQAPRTSDACDAGAFEEGAVAPPISDGGFPDPTPPAPPVQTPVPTPVTTPTPSPTPVVNKTVVVRVVKGTVLVKLAGTNKFVAIDATQGIPVGSTVDTKKGRVELTSVPKPGAPPEKAVFYDGIFKVTQKAGVTDLELDRAARQVLEGREVRGDQGQEAQAVGQREGQVPHVRQVRRGDGSRDAVARGGRLLQGHDGQGQRGVGTGPRQRRRRRTSCCAKERPTWRGPPSDQVHRGRARGLPADRRAGRRGRLRRHDRPPTTAVPCPPASRLPQCSLRMALNNAANSSDTADTINLPAGAYQVTGGDLPVPGGTCASSARART